MPKVHGSGAKARNRIGQARQRPAPSRWDNVGFDMATPINYSGHFNAWRIRRSFRVRASVWRLWARHPPSWRPGVVQAAGGSGWNVPLHDRRNGMSGTYACYRLRIRERCGVIVRLLETSGVRRAGGAVEDAARRPLARQDLGRHHRRLSSAGDTTLPPHSRFCTRVAWIFRSWWCRAPWGRISRWPS
jgi:hypothetical protein